MSFQRERTRLMKLKIFIFLLVNKPPSEGFVFQGRSATPCDGEI